MNKQTSYNIYYKVTSETFPMLPSFAGIIPDRAGDTKPQGKAYICTFKDEMPQNIITRVVQFQLNTILLCGQESPTYIRNLRRTLTTDITPNLQIWKEVNNEKCQTYEDCVDAFVIDINEIDKYQGTHPILISGISANNDLDSLYQKYKGRCLGFITNEFGDTE
jgi:phosphoribosylanthranilate isomerase